MTASQKIVFRLRSSRISTKIAVPFSLLIVLIAAFVYFYLAPRWEEQEMEAFESKVRTIANITAYTLSPALVFEDSVGIHESLQGVLQEKDLVYLVVYNASGEILDAINLEAADTFHQIAFRTQSHISGDGTVFCYSVQIKNRDAEVGLLTLGLSLIDVQEKISAAQGALAVTSVLIMLVGFFAVIIINRLVTKPLAEMVNTAETIAGGDLSHRAPVLAHDEIGQLAKSFNKMVDRLQSAYNELEDINRSLEHRVQDRTRALQLEINERIRSEGALRKSEERYRKFFEEDLTGDFIATPEGILLDCNTAFARMFGFATTQDALGNKLGTFFLEPSTFLYLVDELRKQKKLEYREEVMMRRDRELVHVVQNVVGSFNEHGELTAFRGYLFDDTKRKLLEQQLLQAQKMESIGVLAGGIAHDFNNILGIILGFAHHANSTEKKSPELTHILSSIISASERGAGLVRQLLTFARQADIQVETVQIEPVVEELVAMCRETFPRTVRILSEIVVGLPSINADPNQMHQLFLNLLLNARDAMPNGGTVTIKAHLETGEELRTTIHEAKEEHYIHLSITDTGSGMSRATRERIFEPFFTTKERNKGTGLGLAVVYGIVNSHRGFIDVESEQGVGTSFHIHLPAHVQLQQAPVPVVDEGAHNIGGTETILIVEDEEMLRDLLKTFLEAEGYTVLTAVDGEDGVRTFAQHKEQIALVLSDMGLPKLGGWDAFQQMKLLKPGIRAILASGYFDLQLKAEMVKAGAKDFIQKPYIPKKILRTIRTVLDDNASV